MVGGPGGQQLRAVAPRVFRAAYGFASSEWDRGGPGLRGPLTVWAAVVGPRAPAVVCSADAVCGALVPRAGVRVDPPESTVGSRASGTGTRQGTCRGLGGTEEGLQGWEGHMCQASLLKQEYEREDGCRGRLWPGGEGGRAQSWVVQGVTLGGGLRKQRRARPECRRQCGLALRMGAVLPRRLPWGVCQAVTGGKGTWGTA